MKEAILRLTPELFVEFCKAGEPRMLRVVENALPADAKYVRAGHDINGDLLLAIQSESFADVLPGMVRMELPSPRFEVVR